MITTTRSSMSVKPPCLSSVAIRAFSLSIMFDVLLSPFSYGKSEGRGVPRPSSSRTNFLSRAPT
jgi:hypothetical protein